MELQVQTTFRGIERSEALDRLVRSEARKLERFFERIVSCRVLIERAHQHHQRGSPFHVRIELGVPGTEIVVNNLPGLQVPPETDDGPLERRKSAEVDAPLKDAQLAVREAFRKAGRQLQEYAQRKNAERARLGTS
jgi:Sigma 54 modulation protein / S30EA ribosomal protein